MNLVHDIFRSHTFRFITQVVLQFNALFELQTDNISTQAVNK